MADTNPGGMLAEFIEAGHAAVRAARKIAQRHGDKMVFVGWVGTDGTSVFGGPDSLRRIAEDEETSAHLVRLARCIANQTAVTLLGSLLEGGQPRETLAAIAGVEGAELQLVLNRLHEVNLL